MLCIKGVHRVHETPRRHGSVGDGGRRGSRPCFRENLLGGRWKIVHVAEQCHQKMRICMGPLERIHSSRRVAVPLGRDPMLRTCPVPKSILIVDDLGAAEQPFVSS